MNNIETYIQDKVLTIVLEGPDGSGKTTLALEIYNILHTLFPYRVTLIRNPFSAQLYHQMHSGKLTPFQISMSTLADGVEATLLAKKMIQNAGIIIQDRSALTSAQIYNYPVMNDTERVLWHLAAETVYTTYYNDAQFVLLNSKLRHEDNVFSGMGNYSGLVSDTFGLFGEKYNTFVPTDGKFALDASKIIEIINGELQ